MQEDDARWDMLLADAGSWPLLDHMATEALAEDAAGKTLDLDALLARHELELGIEHDIYGSPPPVPTVEVTMQVQDIPYAQPHIGKVYDPYADEWVDVPIYRFCSLCGDGGWKPGTSCRRVRAAKEAGTFTPRFDEVTGNRLEHEKVSA